MHCPSLADYLELARGHSVVPIYRQLLGDTLTPVTAFRRIQEGDWSFLFESVVGGERLGRYSFVGAGPFLIVRAWDRRVRIDHVAAGKVEEFEHPDPLQLLEERLGAPLRWDRHVPTAPKAHAAPPAAMTTLRIDAGKTDKLRPGDVLGALTGDAGLPASAIGRINVFPTRTYVAVARDKAAAALSRLNAGKIKGRSFRVRKL